jgi:hypothetical protein
MSGRRVDSKRLTELTAVTNMNGKTLESQAYDSSGPGIDFLPGKRS